MTASRVTQTTAAFALALALGGAAPASAAPVPAGAAPAAAAFEPAPFDSRPALGATAEPASGFEIAVNEAASGRLMASDGPLSREPFQTPRLEWGRRDKPKKVRGPRAMPTLSAERARILLRSLTVPGWGQATLGHRRSAGVFLIAEAGVWASFAGFRIQERMRRESTIRTARDLAGIDMRGRDEEFFRIVGSFLSSDEYNQLVVYREAANRYYDDPAKYWEFIRNNELKEGDRWAWPDVESLLRFRAQRKDGQRAGLRANSALAVAIANRLLSAVHAARLAGHTDTRRSWNLEVAPAGVDDPTAFRFGVRTQF